MNNCRELNHVKVLSLPDSPKPDTVYYLLNGTSVSIYLSTSKGDLIPATGSGNSTGGGGTNGLLGVISPEGTIDVETSQGIAQIEIPDDILQEIQQQGETLDQILSIIAEPPTYYPPTSNISFGQSEYEAGTSLSKVISTTFTQNDAGSINQIKIYKDSTLIADSITTDTSKSVNTTLNIPRGSIVFKSQFYYDEGIIKNNNLGQPHPNGHIYEGSITAQKSITGRLRMFFGATNDYISSSGDIRDLTSEVVYENQNSFSFFAENTHMIFAIPDDKNISNLDIQTNNNETLTSNFSNTTVVVNDIGGNPHTYKLFSYATDIPLEATVIVTF